MERGDWLVFSGGTGCDCRADRPTDGPDFPARRRSGMAKEVFDDGAPSSLRISDGAKLPGHGFGFGRTNESAGIQEAGCNGGITSWNGGFKLRSRRRRGWPD